MSQCKPALLDLEPNTPQWLEFRKKGIGASDAPIIMGLSPWKTPMQLWEEKLSINRGSQETESQARGKRLEPFVLDHIQFTLGMELKPGVVRHAEIPYIFSSLDGISRDLKIACEIKCPNRNDHDTAKAGSIPEKYKYQLMHQLETLQLDRMLYVSYAHDFMGEDDFVFVPFFRNDKEIKKMLTEERIFWDRVEEFCPPELTDRDYIERSDSIWSDRARDYQIATEALKKAEDEQRKIREDLIALAEGRSTKGAGISVAKIVRRGAVDYAQIEALKGIDLEKYRKKPIESWRVNLN